jgi:hypothetical protein
MNQRSIFSWLWCILALAACTPVATPSPTPEQIDGAGAAAVEMIQQQMYSNLTQQAIENDRVEAGARATATQQIIDATATQERYQAQAKETARADAATQQAWQVTVQAAKVADAATQQAAEAATQQAIVNEKGTQEANATTTQMAVLGVTATVEAQATEHAWKQTQEAPMITAKSTAMMAEARKVEIELQKSQATMWISAWGGWVFAVFIMGIASFVIWKRSQVGVVMDENGKVRLVMINQRALQPALMSSPVLDFSNGQVVTPNLGVPAETQRQIVHETKIVEAIEALPPGYQRQALGLAGGMTTQAGSPQINIQVVQPDRLAPILDEVEGALLEE